MLFPDHLYHAKHHNFTTKTPRAKHEKPIKSQPSPQKLFLQKKMCSKPAIATRNPLALGKNCRQHPQHNAGVTLRKAAREASGTPKNLDL